MAKHSKYEPAEREIIEKQMSKVWDAVFDLPRWPKIIPYSDIGEEWETLMTNIQSYLIDFDKKWNLFEDDDDL